ncbi:MAG: HNH endonuclease [Solirubrobacteraceae bacterium]|nr:HNH endonuclease [Solirubrobacteraceae bacterium]
MLRIVEQAAFEPVGHGLRRRWVFRTGTLEGDAELSGRALRRLLTEQESRPVAVLTDGARTWWMSGGVVVSGHAELSADDVAALLAERADREARRLERAHAARARQAEPTAPPDGRRPIPRDVRLAVWERDGGRCVECGTDFDLQYDHVIPIALGGASTAANLQLLCGPCNRRKGAAIA